LKGYVHVYTGPGKGKTTAALGLALRAAGAGFKVFIAQFVKGMQYGELDALKRFTGQITLKQYGRDCFISGVPTEEDCRMAREGLDEVQKIVASGEYQLVIMDEANIAVYYNLFPVDGLVTIINNIPENVELVITGRYADPTIIDKADLVTEMCEIKHYYHKGVKARRGIEF
jgi:cob(I)alamin adenosyltransferase